MNPDGSITSNCTISGDVPPEEIYIAGTFGWPAGLPPCPECGNEFSNFPYWSPSGGATGGGTGLPPAPPPRAEKQIEARERRIAK